jgi:beta-lactamase class A
MRLRLLAAALLSLCAPRLAAQGDPTVLRRTLEAELSGYPGVAGVAVRNLTTGETISIHGEQTFPSASLIKVPVLVTLLDEVRQDRMALDERIGMIARDRVEGDGVLQYMGSGLNLTLGDAAWLMITLSDNTATNLILDRIDIRTVWTKMESLGLPHSKIHSKTFRRATSLAMDSSVKYGLGVTTPDEMVRLFALLHQGQAVSPPLDSLALTLLRANQDHTKLVRWLPEEMAAAHKTGEVDASRNDCGILYTPAAPLAVCVMTRENTEHSYMPDNPANLLMARIGRAVYRHYNPGAPLPPSPGEPSRH